MENNKNKILIGLSGGVDSAVGAALLLEAGFDVTACYLCLTRDASPESPDAASARQTAGKLGIPFFTADHRQRFKEKVEDYFAAEYLAGRTPNPCVRCNPEVKIASLCEEADRLGIEFVATGHYAQTAVSEGRTYIAASPSKKDQSYFLCGLTGRQAERIVFPLGGFTSKEEIREKARLLGFASAEKPDSLEICFIPDNDYAGYICRGKGYRPVPGDFLDIDGNVIGTHSGIIHYTVGQRKGLGAFGAPRYVKYVNAKDNTVTLCTKEERFADRLTAKKLSWNGPVPAGEFRAQVKIRSTAPGAPASVKIENGVMTVFFASPVIAPTPGQTAAVYRDGLVLGGGIITE